MPTYKITIETSSDWTTVTVPNGSWVKMQEQAIEVTGREIIAVRIGAGSDGVPHGSKVNLHASQNSAHDKTLIVYLACDDVEATVHIEKGAIGRTRVSTPPGSVSTDNPAVTQLRLRA